MKPSKTSHKEALRMPASTAPTLADTSPWDFWLKFRNPRVDSEYEASVAGERRTLAALGFKVSMAAGVLKLGSLGSTATAAGAACFAWILFSGFIVPWFHLRELTDRWDTCGRYRIRVLYFYRLVVPLGWGVVLLSQDPLTPWDPTRIWSTIVSHTPISALFFGTFFFRVPFKKHALLQGIGALISWLWVINFSHACNADEDIAASSNHMGWLTEGVILATAVFGIRVKRPVLQLNDYPCWLLGLFFHFWLGFFVPCACAYHWESASKSVFLKEHSKTIPIVDFRTFKTGRALLAAFLLVVGTQVLWFSFKGIASAETGCRSIKF